MTEPPARIWLNQVESDRQAALRVLDRSNEQSYCQAIAKHQQTVEKCVRAIVAALRDHGLMELPTGRTHKLDYELSALVRLRKGKGGNTDIPGQI